MTANIEWVESSYSLGRSPWAQIFVERGTNGRYMHGTIPTEHGFVEVIQDVCQRSNGDENIVTMYRFIWNDRLRTRRSTGVEFTRRQLIIHARRWVKEIVNSA